MCIRSVRRPVDWEATRTRLTTEDVRLTVCYPTSHAGDLELSIPSPIVVPPIDARYIQRIIDEYVQEARAELSIALSLTREQRGWIVARCEDHYAIDIAVRRFLALSHGRNISAAAHRLGMAPISMSRWLRRRGLTVDMVIGRAPL